MYRNNGDSHWCRSRSRSTVTTLSIISKPNSIRTGISLGQVKAEVLASVNTPLGVSCILMNVASMFVCTVPFVDCNTLVLMLLPSVDMSRTRLRSPLLRSQNATVPSLDTEISSLLERLNVRSNTTCKYSYNTLPDSNTGSDSGLRFLSYAEIGSRDPSPRLCNVNMFCIVQVWNRNPNRSSYPSLSSSM